MKYRLKYMAVLLCIGLISPVAGFCGSRFPAEIGSVGTAVVSGENEARAREDAMADAVFRALVQYLTEGLGAEVMQDNYSRIKENVFPKAAELAENFLILAEDRTGSSLSVLLRVRFNDNLVEELLRDAGVPLEAEHERRILLMAAEGTDGRYSFWWQDPSAHFSLSPVELAVRKAFEQRRLEHVDLGVMTAGEIIPSLKVRHLDESRLAEWGTLYGADFVLYGSSDLYAEGELVLSLKAVSAADGRILAETSRFGKAEGPVLEAADLVSVMNSVAAEVADVLAPAMLGLDASESGTRVVSVVFEGADVLADSPPLQRYMEEDLSAVTRVRSTRLGRSRVVFEVTYRGDPRLLAERLAGQEAPFPMRPTFDADGAIRIERPGSIDRVDKLLWVVE